MEQATAMADVLVGAGEQVADALRGAAHGRRRSRRTSSRSTAWRTRATGSARDAIASLFANGIDPMVVIRWKDVFESLESAWTPARRSPTCSRGSRSKRTERRGVRSPALSQRVI